MTLPPNPVCSGVSPLPTLSLAPMQDVSVLPLWRCLERRGGPDLYVTEYFRVHRDSHPEKTILRSINEMSGIKPVIAQMIGNDPEHLVRTTKLIQETSDCAGIDLNLGCPAPKVCGKAAGGALLRDRELIHRIAHELRSAVRGTLTLKTRIGFDSPEEFTALLELFASLPIDGLAIHGRTVKEKYQTPVHPESIERAVSSLPFPVTANGNIVSVDTALAMHRRTGAAGLMIGRGGIRNPWLFRQVKEALSGAEVHRPRLRDLRDYLLELGDEIDKEGDFDTETQLVHRLKKFTNYISSGISEGTLNDELRRTTSLSSFREICDRHLDSDLPFPVDPADDGKLFCGFCELV
ncbi:MAG: tRNA-dihydrouridine synthase family protein [Verrucomicrobiales bacterium]|nr:tRNA-dihydrouridine synthase family protein [Verrucomicrobiales bacterium]